MHSDTQGMVSHDRSGLPCRADVLCSFTSRVTDDLASSLQAAALLRNTHEQDVHAYIHVPIDTRSWAFTQRFSKAGRSTMNRRVRA
jgi:hypothetical protein